MFPFEEFAYLKDLFFSIRNCCPVHTWVLHRKKKRPGCGNFCLELEPAEGLRSLKGCKISTMEGKTKRSSKSKGNQRKINK